MRNGKIKGTPLVLRGSAYETGKQLGELLKNEGNTVLQISRYSQAAEEQRKYQHLYEMFCPKILEEMQGFGDTLGIDAADILYFFSGTMEKMQKNEHSSFVKSQIDGRYAHAGWLCRIFGRTGGMNEYGLCVESEIRVVFPPDMERSIPYYAAVRTILEQCRTVDEAIELLEHIPVAYTRNLGLVDTRGNAALITGKSRGYSVIREAEVLDRNVMIGLQRTMMKRFRRGK